MEDPTMAQQAAAALNQDRADGEHHNDGYNWADMADHWPISHTGTAAGSDPVIYTDGSELSYQGEWIAQ